MIIAGKVSSEPIYLDVNPVALTVTSVAVVSQSLSSAIADAGHSGVDVSLFVPSSNAADLVVFVRKSSNAAPAVGDAGRVLKAGGDWVDLHGPYDDDFVVYAYSTGATGSLGMQFNLRR